MVKKLILHSIGNSGKYNYYIFDKKQNALEILNKIFAMDFDLHLITNYDNLRKNKKMNDVKRRIDVHFSDSCEGIRTDFFYGKKKMHLTLICSENLRLKFNKSLFKHFTMLKSKKIKLKRKSKK